jgi:hypothetical protein
MVAVVGSGLLISGGLAAAFAHQWVGAAIGFAAAAWIGISQWPRKR